MKYDERVHERLVQLIESGRKVEDSTYQTRSDVFVHADVCQKWATSSTSFLRQVFGEHSTHYEHFLAAVKKYYERSQVKCGVAVLEAALDDYMGGWLGNTRDLIRADVFTDLLEQAHYLFNEGYHVPAAVLTGAVLEDAIRQLYTRHVGELPDKPKLDKMNADLVKAGAYNTIVQKQVIWLAGIRNAAAHGETEKFTIEDVNRMVPDVVSFLATHFSSTELT